MQEAKKIEPRSPIPTECAIVSAISFFPESVKKLTIVPDDFKNEFCRELFAAVVQLVHEGWTNDQPGFLGVLGSRVSDLSRGFYMGLFDDPTIEVGVKIEVLEREIRSIWAENIVSEIVSRENITDPVRINSLIETKIKELTPQTIAKSATELAKEVYANVEQGIELKGAIAGIPTGITLVDKATNGLLKSLIYIVAARTSMGKSAFMANLFISAMRSGRAPVFVTLEEKDVNFYQRLTSILSSVGSETIRKGATADQAGEVIAALDELAKFQPRIISAHGMSSAHICSMITSLHNSRPVDMVILDHIQEVRENLGKFSRRDQEIEKAMQNFRQLSHRLHAPVVIACQINRSVEGRQDKRPAMADLKESGALEQIADVIMLLYRGSYYDGAQPDLDTMEINIAKNRDGRTGMVRASFEPRCLRIGDWSEYCYTGAPQEQMQAARKKYKTYAGASHD